MATDKAKRPTVEQIEAAYRQGYLTAADKNTKMRLLADENLEDYIGENGMLKAYFTQTVKHVQQQWDEFVQMADEYKPAQAGSKQQTTIGGAINESLATLDRAKNIIWNQIQVLTAPFTAFSEVNETVARRWAQDAGASPGLSKVIGVSVGVGSNFVPVGRVAQSFARSVQKNVPEMAAAMQKLGGAGKAAGEAEAAKTAAKAADQAIAGGLVDDGVNLEGLEGFIDDAASLVAPAKALPAPDDFYKALRKYHNEIKDITETKHLKDIEAEANKLGIHLDDLKALGQGTPLTSAQIKAYQKTLEAPTDNLIELAGRVKKGDPQAMTAFDNAQVEYFNYTPKFRAAEVEMGRGVKVLDSDPRMKSITEMMKAWAPEEMAKLNIDAARRIMAEDWLALAEQTEKIKLLQVQAASGVIPQGPTFWSKLREAYSGVLLMQPKTWARNFTGSVFSASTSVLERQAAGYFSIDQAKGVTRGEGMAMLQGFQAAMGEGVKEFGKAFKNIGPDDANQFDFIPHQIQGPLGRILNVGHDVLRGTDNFWKVILRNADIYAQAIRQGRHAGLEGDALADYALRRRAIPTEAMKAHAQDYALNQTFQNDLGTIGQSIKKIAQYGPFFYWFPYMKTPMNLAKYSWNRTPGLQLISESLYTDILAGGARADMAIGRLTMSNMMAMFWFGLHRQGVISDGGPVDAGLRRTWLDDHQPYSFRGKDGTWYPIPAMEPATTGIYLMSDFSAIMNQLDDPTAEQGAMALVLSGVRDIADKTYWQSMGQVVDMVGSIRAGEEWGAAAKRLGWGPAVTAASLGTVPATTARIADPVRREARGFVDQWMARVPGYSKELPPMRDAYGDPFLPPAALGSDYLQLVSPFTFKPEQTDAVKKEGSRLQAKIPMFPWNIGGKMQDDFDVRSAQPGEKLPVPLTPEQRDRWQVLYRNILRHPETGLDQLINSDEYKSRPLADQREMFMNFAATARSASKEILLGEDKELAAKAIKSTAASVLPHLTAEERPEAEAQFSEAQDLVGSMSAEEQDNLLKWGLLDSGAERDQEIIRGYRGEISKSIPELNQAAQQPQSPEPARSNLMQR